MLGCERQNMKPRRLATIGFLIIVCVSASFELPRVVLEWQLSRLALYGTNEAQLPKWILEGSRADFPWSADSEADSALRDLVYTRLAYSTIRTPDLFVALNRKGQVVSLSLEPRSHAHLAVLCMLLSSAIVIVLIPHKHVIK